MKILLLSIQRILKIEVLEKKLQIANEVIKNQDATIKEMRKIYDLNKKLLTRLYQHGIPHKYEQ